ncbi:unnamed protein product, partial [Meganyctiphanes norvegica]
SGRLEKAMTCYRLALDWSVNSIEKSSALKNIALTSMKLFKVQLNMGKQTSKTDYYLKDGLQSFDLASNHGLSGGQEQSWSNALCERYMESIDSLFHHLVTKSTKDRIHMLEEIARKLKNKQAKSRIFRETARVYFNSSVVSLEAGEFKSCLSQLRDCHHPLEEAKLCNTDPNGTDMEDITELETSVFLQQCRAESLQARDAGDDLLKKSINDSENLDMEAVFIVIDFYKQAILLTKEVEV